MMTSGRKFSAFDLIRVLRVLTESGAEIDEDEASGQSCQPTRGKAVLCRWISAYALAEKFRSSPERHEILVDQQTSRLSSPG